MGSLGQRAGSHQLKFVGVAAAVVFFWFIYRLGLHHEARDQFNKIVKGDPHVYEPAHYTGPPLGSSDSGIHPDVLSAEAATQYCANFRLDAVPREMAAKRKVYDLLLINTELEMLDVRLGQMSPGVDYFVVLESDKTFTDQAKPLFVQENWGRFAAYHDQIIRRTMDLTTGAFTDTWSREGASRNAMYDQVIPFLTGEQAASIDDVLLVSDVDEMFKPEVLKAMRNCRISNRVTAVSRMFYYSFQWLQDLTWPHPQATLYKGVENTILPDDLRKHSDQHYVFAEGGWHCSYCFSTLKEMVTKITSFSHSELNRPEFKDPVKIIDRVRHGKDM
jgi:beta-1,4-mannosyl-glycoprotein beta-1,4-N-acetylglucosaminyltransferase